jgi:RHS repeat-associated protein
VVAARTGTVALAYLAGDSQATDSVAIDAATLSVTRRYFDPYGNPRGTTPATFPAGQKGFIGGTADTATGLTNLGARQYQPATGSFISPDPLLKPYDPQDLNAYIYAKGNPATYSDPTGQCSDPGCAGAEHAPPYHPGGAGIPCGTAGGRACNPPKGSSSAPTDPAGSDGGRRICNGYGCASRDWWRNHHDDPAAHTRAPVTRPPETCISLPRLGRGKFCMPDTKGSGFNWWSWFEKGGSWLLAVMSGFAPFAETAAGAGAGAFVFDLTDIENVEQHLKGIEAWLDVPHNRAMVNRIRAAISEGRALTEGEYNFMLHELTEADLMTRGVEQKLAHEFAGKVHPTFANYDKEVVKEFFEYFNDNWLKYWERREK